MARLLADENVPQAVVVSLVADGHDITSMRTIGPGSPDTQVLALALADRRIVLTFDKDFGELAFRLGQKATPGVILLRPRVHSLHHLRQFTKTVLAQTHTWEGNFVVAEEGRIRIVPLPI